MDVPLSRLVKGQLWWLCQKNFACVRLLCAEVLRLFYSAFVPQLELRVAWEAILIAGDLQIWCSSFYIRWVFFNYFSMAEMQVSIHCCIYISSNCFLSKFRYSACLENGDFNGRPVSFNWVELLYFRRSPTSKIVLAIGSWRSWLALSLSFITFFFFPFLFWFCWDMICSPF